MRAFATFAEVKSEVARDLKELAVIYQSQSVQDQFVLNDPDFQTHELINYSYTLLDPRSVDVPNDQAFYIAQEFRERISGERINPGSAFLNDEDYWSQFLHDDPDGGPRFSYTYAERMADALQEVIFTLRTDKNSRRAYLPIYWPEDALNGARTIRIPCSIGYHFMVRAGQVMLHYTMRSCDFAKHFHKDVALAIMLQQYVAEQIRMEEHLGLFTHTIFSLHAFDKDLKGIF
jgi:thymidylate synthase